MCGLTCDFELAKYTRIAEKEPHRRQVNTTNEENKDNYGPLFNFYLEFKADQDLFM